MFDFKRVSGGITSNTGRRGRVSVHWSCHMLSWNLLCDHIDVKWALCCTCPRFLTLDLTNRLSPEAAGIQLMCKSEKLTEACTEALGVVFYSQTQAAHLLHYKAGSLCRNMQVIGTQATFHYGNLESTSAYYWAVIKLPFCTELLFTYWNQQENISHIGQSNLLQEVQKITVIKQKKQ